MPIRTLEQDLESAIDKAFQKMDYENLVAIICQMIINRDHQTRHYLLSDYSREHELL